jgi:hypothetical protein
VGQVAVLLLVAEALDELGIEFHVGGSLASGVHGVPRQTRDIDLVVALDARDVEPLLARLGEAFYADGRELARAVRERKSTNLVHIDSGVKVDLFVRGSAPFDRSEFDRAGHVVLGEGPGRPVRIKSAEDTVLRKLHWYRTGGEVSERQWSDVVGLLKTRIGTLDEPYLDRWARELGVLDLLAEAVREAG